MTGTLPCHRCTRSHLHSLGKSEFKNCPISSTVLGKCFEESGANVLINCGVTKTEKLCTKTFTIHGSSMFIDGSSLFIVSQQPKPSQPLSCMFHSQNSGSVFTPADLAMDVHPSDSDLLQRLIIVAITGG